MCFAHIDIAGLIIYMRKSYIFDAITVPSRSALSPVEGLGRAAKPRAGSSMVMTEIKSAFVHGNGAKLTGRLEPPEERRGLGELCPLLHLRERQSRRRSYFAGAVAAGIGVLRFNFAEPGFNYGIHGIGRPKCKWRSDR